jgi:hypothetical protein
MDGSGLCVYNECGVKSTHVLVGCINKDFLSVDGHQQRMCDEASYIIVLGELVNFSGEGIFKVCGMHCKIKVMKT